MNSDDMPSTSARMAAEADVTVFELYEGRTLWVAGFHEILKRSDAYALRADWAASAPELAEAMDECPPLAWKVHRLYSDYRDELVEELANSNNRDGANAAKFGMLEAKLDAMPEEPEYGTAPWLQGIDRNFFKTTIVKSISEWFDEKPGTCAGGFDYDEFDYVPNAQEAALKYFSHLDRETRKLLGVVIIEGDCPGSSYYAAELRRPIEEANEAAIRVGLPVRFVAQTLVNGNENACDEQ